MITVVAHPFSVTGLVALPEPITLGQRAPRAKREETWTLKTASLTHWLNAVAKCYVAEVISVVAAPVLPSGGEVVSCTTGNRGQGIRMEGGNGKG
jgi:hypothetical protein